MKTGHRLGVKKKMNQNVKKLIRRKKYLIHFKKLTFSPQILLFTKKKDIQTVKQCLISFLQKNKRKS